MDLPKRLVLLGHPVAHSLSPAFQNVALRSAGIPLTYETLDVPPRQLNAVTAMLREANGAGNVTVPHKEVFAALCDTRSPIATRVGAVNTFWMDGHALAGDNTDVGGFEAAVKRHFGPPPPHPVVAIVGAGGSAAAVLAAVERWESARAVLFSRSRLRAAALVQRFARIATMVSDEAALLENATLLVNATPVGLEGDGVPLDPGRIPPNVDVMDLVYRRGETPWVHACRARDLRAADGLAMLVEQGALSFERWFGAIPDRDAMWRAVARDG